jgi:hypothetical protein
MKNKDEWIKTTKENWRVEVGERGYHGGSEEDTCDDISYRLNMLFEEHKDWKDAYAETNYDEVDRCIFCNDIYEPMYDKEREDYVCSYCGKGKLELAVKILSEGKEKDGNNIL